MYKKLFAKKHLFFAFAAIVAVGLWIPKSYGQEDLKMMWGFSFGVGFPQKSRHDLTLGEFLPRVDIPLHKNWDFEIEGNFSYYAREDVKNLYVLGLNVNILFKPIQWKTGSLFILGGVGGGYNNNNDHNPKTWDIGDTHVTGIVQGGAGINYSIGNGWWLRGEYRYHHISDPFRTDRGINTHDLMLGLWFSK